MGETGRTPELRGSVSARLAPPTMFDFTSFLSYLAAAMLLVLAPGPGQMLVLARTLAGGRSAG
jgi:hypothetical protein